MSQKLLDHFRANYREGTVEEITLSVLRNNTYCVLSTATPVGEPWVTPVRFRCDNEGNLYWTSARNARHSELVKVNPTVSAVVIDLRFINTVSSAVYCSGSAREIPFEELPKFIHWRYPEEKRTVEDFNPEKQHRAVYRLQTKAMWCLAEPVLINNVLTDKRVSVDLQTLQKLFTIETL